MSQADLENFIKAVEAVKQDHTCGVCSEFCKDPVTLSTCFHIICSEHFESLQACPTCHVSTDNAIMFRDDRLDRAVQATREIWEMASGLAKQLPANQKEADSCNQELESNDIRVFCSSAFRTVYKKLKNLSKSHSNLHIEVEFTKEVTHLIVDTNNNGTCNSSYDVLQGVLNSIWILSTRWVLKSTDSKLESFDEYEVKGIGPKAHQGPKQSRYCKYKLLPGLFDGCHFYLHNFIKKYRISESLTLTKRILKKLLTDGGGVVLKSVPDPEKIPQEEKLVPYHAVKNGKLELCTHYIIFKDKYEPMYNMQHTKALPVEWLIECMEKYELCDP